MRWYGMSLVCSSNLAASLANGSVNGKCGCDEQPVVDKCDNLKDGQQYYLKSADGKFAVLDTTKQLGFMYI